MSTDLTNRVCALVADAIQVGAAEIGPATAFGDLPQWDSMGHMEIMMRLETDFGVEVSADTISTLTSVAAICAHLQAKE